MTEQNPNSKWTQWKFFFCHRRHPSCLSVLAKSEFIGELIENDRLAMKPDEVGDFLNRSPQHCRYLTESFDWYIQFDIHTDQFLVHDLSIGWYDMKRLSFHVHQDSLHQGIKNYEKLRDGTLLKEDHFFVFTDILNGHHLHVINLEREKIWKVQANFNTLFMEKFATCDFLAEIKNNKFIKTGAVKKQVLLAINKLNQANWTKLQVCKVKFEDAQKRDNKVILELIYYLKVNVDGFPKVNFSFLATFIVTSLTEVTISEIVNLGMREVPSQKTRIAQMSVD